MRRRVDWYDGEVGLRRRASRDLRSRDEKGESGNEGEVGMRRGARREEGEGKWRMRGSWDEKGAEQR